MQPTRAALYGSVALSVILVGCTSVVNDGSTLSATPSPVPTNCTPDDLPVVDPIRDSVEPSDYPETPETWTDASVEQYVVGVERVVARNDALRRESTRVEVVVSDVTVDRNDGTWIVELTSRTNTWAAGTPVGSRTPTVVHGDGPNVPIVYRVTDQALYRRVGDTGTTPNRNTASQSTQGRIIVCFDQ